MNNIYYSFDKWTVKWYFTLQSLMHLTFIAQSYVFEMYLYWHASDYLGANWHELLSHKNNFVGLCVDCVCTRAPVGKTTN